MFLLDLLGTVKPLDMLMESELHNMFKEVKGPANKEVIYRT